MSNISSKQNPLRVVLNRIGEPSIAHYGTARTPINTPEAIYRFWNEIVASDPTFEPDKEHLITIFLNTKLHPTGYHIVSVGSLNESIAHPREIIRAAIVAGAYGIILAHNHPSGDPTPSEADRRVTRRVAEGADILQIRFLDHMVAGHESRNQKPFFSFRENGFI